MTLDPNHEYVPPLSPESERLMEYELKISKAITAITEDKPKEEIIRILNGADT